MTQVSNVNLWTQYEILNRSFDFIQNESQQISSHFSLWKSAAANWNDPYNDRAFEAAKNYKAVVLLSKTNVKALDHAILKALETVDDQMTRTKLVEIASLTKHALNYFTALAENSKFPSLLGKGFQWLSTTSIKALLAGSVLSTVTAVSFEVLKDSRTPYPEHFFTPFKVTAIATLGINTLYLLYRANNAWNHKKIRTLEAPFVISNNSMR